MSLEALGATLVSVLEVHKIFFTKINSKIMSKEVNLTSQEDAVWIEYKKDPDTGKTIEVKKLMSDMTDAQLRRAKLYAQARILHHHNLASKFDLLVEQLEDEAATRGVEIEDYDRPYFENERKLKAAIGK